MARATSALRKGRTRGHVIADLSVKPVERLIIDAGHTPLRLEKVYDCNPILFPDDEP